MSARPTPRVLAVDATLWDEPTTGIGLYTRQLVEAIERQGQPLVKLGARRSGEAPRGELSRSAWTLGPLSGALRRREAALYHAHGNFNLPLTRIDGTPFVLTVHDLIPDLLPATVSFGFRTQFRVWLTRSLQLADRIICVSETTRNDLIRRFDVRRENTVVVYNGVDHVDAAAPLDAAGTATLRSLPPEYVLFAGSWDVRKNVLQVLEAWHSLPDSKRVPLVLVGQAWFGSGPAEQRVTALKSAGLDIRPLGYQPAAVLYDLMRHATVFVFPSLYEGFGLPPLEAMRLGAATIVSNRGSLPEVCGDAAIAVDPDDTSALTAALTRLLDSPAERDELRSAGRAHAATFTWSRAATETLAVYEDVLRR